MDELRKQLDDLARLIGSFFDDACNQIDQAIDTLERLTETAGEEQCQWRRAQVRSDHGELSNYGRRCDLIAGHPGDHRTPKAAKQTNSGVWFNPDSGDTRSQ